MDFIRPGSMPLREEIGPLPADCMSDDDRGCNNRKWGTRVRKPSVSSKQGWESSLRGVR